MFRPQRPQIPHMRRAPHRHPHNSQWRHPYEPRATFRGQHQRFIRPRPPFQSENDNYWCETCDRGFPTEDILNKHKQQHQKCNIDGCQFIAHPNVITKHIQMQHATGIYKKIANLKNPEEIAKWREERRRKYPTKANIEKKAAELKEKIGRGEKMGLERDRSYRNKPNFEQNNKSGQGIKRKSNTINENQTKPKFKRTQTNNNSNKDQTPKAKPKITSIVEDHGLKPFAGIQNLETDSDNEVENDTAELNSLIEDEDYCEGLNVAENEKATEIAEPIVCGALSLLMCDYGSSEEEDNGELNTKSKNTTQLKNMQESKSNMQKPKNTVSNTSEVIYNDIDASIKSNRGGDTTLTKSTDETGNSISKNETDMNSMDFVSAAKIKNNSNKVQNVIKKVTETSTQVDHDNSSCKPEAEKTESIKIIHTQESNVNINCDDAVVKDLQEETINNGDESDSAPEEVKAEIKKEDTSVLDQSIPTENRKKIVKGRTQAIHRRRPKLPSTLLQKLLFKEMQQERNIVLQCIRYIRRNNYFDKNE